MLTIVHIFKYRSGCECEDKASQTFDNRRLIYTMVVIKRGVLARLCALCVVVRAIASAFVGPRPGYVRPTSPFAKTSTLFDAAVPVASATTSITVSLNKPLGLILEEVEEGAAAGVFVLEVGEAGSAAKSEFADQFVGAKLSTVQGEDVKTLVFDEVMDKLINAPDTVDLELLLKGETTTTAAPDEAEPPASFPEGTKVTIKVLQENNVELPIEAKVGDNLRSVLLENNVELYQGIKQKLGNCGGGGQCAFCAVDVVESEGWLERSDYEDGKLRKRPAARLACLNNIQGPATIQKSK